MTVELESIKNKILRLVDKPAGVKHTGTCNTKMKACNITHVPMEPNLKISDAENEPKINASGVK